MLFRVCVTAHNFRPHVPILTFDGSLDRASKSCFTWAIATSWWQDLGCAAVLLSRNNNMLHFVDRTGCCSRLAGNSLVLSWSSLWLCCDPLGPTPSGCVVAPSDRTDPLWQRYRQERVDSQMRTRMSFCTCKDMYIHVCMDENIDVLTPV